MANTLYLSHLAEAKIRNMASPEYAQVMSTLEALEQDPLGNTKDITEAQDLRIARPGDLRIILRYVPAEHGVLVTNITRKQFRTIRRISKLRIWPLSTID